MEKTPQEMAEHVRAAVNNLNEVLKEAQKSDLKIHLYINGIDGYPGSVGIKSITLVKSF